METRVCPMCRTSIDQGELDKLVTNDMLTEFKITGMCARCQGEIYGPAKYNSGQERAARRGGTITGSNNWRD